MASLKKVNEALEAVKVAEGNLSDALDDFGTKLEEYKEEIRQELGNAGAADIIGEEENED